MNNKIILLLYGSAQLSVCHVMQVLFLPSLEFLAVKWETSKPGPYVP